MFNVSVSDVSDGDVRLTMEIDQRLFSYCVSLLKCRKITRWLERLTQNVKH